MSFVPFVLNLVRYILHYPFLYISLGLSVIFISFCFRIFKMLALQGGVSFSFPIIKIGGV
ncbi:hypothetical protein WN944_019901 [Citrus x changshan-huyou]|uniref:Uncharacterized protein n=1 Tax=Citrus x changshan-huyou TaxID=2935761 RepID=A0AAP0LW67_9ROSI